MSTLNFDVFWRDRGAAKGLQNLGREADKTHKSFDKATKTTSGFGSLTGLAFKAAGVAAVGYGLKVASGNEQARISFTTMLGSAQKADVFLKQLQKFAATTPFEFPELQTAASSLISAGVNANKVIPIMRTLGDVTAGMGTGAQGVQRATVALQQMNAAGKITAEDLNQLRDAGIPVYDLLAAATKKSKTEVAGLAAAGKLGRKELEQLMVALESGKGLEKFNGLMEQQSKSLGGMISTLRDDLGQGLAGALQGLFPIIKASIGAWNDMGGATKATLGIIAGSAVVFGTAAGGAVKLSGAFQTLGLSAKSAKTAVGGVGAALTVATLAFGLYASSHAKAEAKIDDFTQALNGETEAVNQSVRAVAAKQLQDAGALESAQMLGLSLSEVTDAALGQGDALARIQPLLDGYVATGVNGTIVEQDRATAAGKVNDAIKGVGGSYNKAAVEAKQMNAATADSAGAMGSMKDKTISAKEALQQWRTEMVKSARAAIDLEGSQDAVEAAVDNATAAVKDNGKTLDNNTEKGRNNRAALRNLASSSIAYREKLIEQGASQKKVTGTTMEAREAFIKTAIKMGATRKEAKELADKFGLVDKKINDLNNKTVKTKVTFSVSGSGFKLHIPNSLSVVKEMAAGGPVRGPGGATSDSVLGIDRHGIPTARVSAGEFVVNAKAYQRNRSLVEAINRDGLATGGVVDPRIYSNRFPNPGYTGNALQTRAARAISKSIGNAVGKALESTGMGIGFTGPSGPRTSFRGGTFTTLFARNLALVERAAHQTFRVFQGGWRPRTSYSGTSHAGDAIDFQVNYSLGRLFRKYIGASGDRTGKGNWSPHIHAVPSPSHGRARGSAVWQYQDYVRRGGARQSMRSPWGLARGGTMMDSSMIGVAESGPERVLTAAQTRSFDRLVRVMDKSGGTTSVTYIINAPHYVGDKSDLKRALVDLNRQGALQVIKR